MQIIDLVWTLAGLLLTLMVFSYVFGDNVLFRIAVYLFVGVTAGYVLVITVYNSLLPRLIWPLITGSLLERILSLIPLILGILFLGKLVPRFSNVGSIPMAYLVGAGAAVTIGGAVLGTLAGQVAGTINAFNLRGSANPLGALISGIVVLVGAICTLVYFQFSATSRGNLPARRGSVVEFMAQIGQVFIAITLGALFAGVYAAAVSALIERLDSIKSFLTSIIG
jgi:hypothetical protein